MEARRFDRLTAAWARRRSRRGALALLGSGALAGSLTLPHPEPVAARCRHGSNCTKDRIRLCHHTSACIKVKHAHSGRCACIEDFCGTA